jgi:hypothetical protein
VGSGLAAQHDGRTDCGASQDRSEMHHSVCVSMKMCPDGVHFQENIGNTQ